MVLHTMAHLTTRPMTHAGGQPRLSIIGCGNTNRSDDGVGVYVARRLSARLAARPAPGVSVFDAGTAGMDVMFAAKGSAALIIIDASVSGSLAGDIFEVPGEELRSVKEPGYNLHDFRWQHALHAGKKIFKDGFPDDVSVFLIEAENTGMGLDLTAKVRRAADRVVEIIADRIAARPTR